MSKVTIHKHYSHPVSGEIFRLSSLGEVLRKFAPEKHEAIKRLAATSEGVAVFANLDKHSLTYGRHVAVMFGRLCNIKSMDEVAQMNLGGDKSQGCLFATYYWEKT